MLFVIARISVHLTGVIVGNGASAATSVGWHDLVADIVIIRCGSVQVDTYEYLNSTRVNNCIVHTSLGCTWAKCKSMFEDTRDTRADENLKWQDVLNVFYFGWMMVIVNTIEDPGSLYYWNYGKSSVFVLSRSQLYL